AVVAEAVPRPGDGEPLFVEQAPDAAYQQDFVVLAVAPVAPPLDGLELVEFVFPGAQATRLDAAQVGDFADGEVALGGDRRQRGRGRGGRHAASPLVPTPSLSFWLAWNVTTLRAAMGMTSPVLGLRPGRGGLLRTWKLPKPDS